MLKKEHVLRVIFSLQIFGLPNTIASQANSNTILNDTLFQIKSLKKQENLHFEGIKHELRLLRGRDESGQGSSNNTILADEEWSDWSTCSRSCGAGTQKRTKTTFSGMNQQLQYCNLIPCPGTGRECLNFGGSQYCDHVKFGAICINERCVCLEEGLNNDTCLPDVGSCHIQVDPLFAVVGKKSMDTTISGGYRLRSCTANDNDKYEVHMVGIYGDRIHNDMCIRLIPKDVISKPIILVLTSYESTRWEVDSPVPIQMVIYGGYRSSSVTLTNNTATEVVQDPSYGYGYGESNGNTVDNLKLVASSYGPVTSFTGYYELDPPNLTIEILVGGNPMEAKTEIPPLSPTTTHPTTALSKTSTTTIKTEPISAEGKACLDSNNCWLKYRFNYDDIYTACHGDQYIKGTGFAVGAYLGVVLCNELGDRYKLFMSVDPGEMFLNIADGSGNGEDHCELVGGDINKAKLSLDFWKSPTTIGYYRYEAETDFWVGRIGHGPQDMSQWTGKYYGTWYECALDIPGNINVVIN